MYSSNHYWGQVEIIALFKKQLQTLCRAGSQFLRHSTNPLHSRASQREKIEKE